MSLYEGGRLTDGGRRHAALVGLRRDVLRVVDRAAMAELLRFLDLALALARANKGEK